MIRLPLAGEQGDRVADWQQPVTDGGPIPVMRTPRNVDLAITGKCNLRCRTCFYADEMVALSDLPTSTWLALLGELGHMGVMTVLLTGGEPFTRPDSLTLIDAVVDNRQRFRVNTNGMLLDDAKADHLAASGRCDAVQVSVDGSCPEVHDGIRGPGSFAGAVAAITRLQRRGVPVTVRVTINRRNLHDLARIFALLFDDLGLTSVSCNEAFPRGAAQCNLSDLDLGPHGQVEAERLCLEAARRHPTLEAQAGPLANARTLAHVRADLARPEAERSAHRGTLSACGIASRSLAILHDGTVVPCHQLPHMVLGKAGVDSLETLWREAVGLHYLRTRHRIPLGRLEECRDCRYQAYCTGGCPAIAYAASGRMNARNPRDCLRILLGEETVGDG